MNEDLSTFAKWALASRLTVNVDKTKYMVLHNSERRLRELCHGIKIIYNAKPLQRVDKYNYLGFTLDEKTTFESHINRLLSNS